MVTGNTKRRPTYTSQIVIENDLKTPSRSKVQFVLMRNTVPSTFCRLLRFFHDGDIPVFCYAFLHACPLRCGFLVLMLLINSTICTLLYLPAFRLTLELACIMGFRRYPLDVQRCPMTIGTCKRTTLNASESQIKNNILKPCPVLQQLPRSQAHEMHYLLNLLI